MSKKKSTVSIIEEQANELVGFIDNALITLREIQGHVNDLREEGFFNSDEANYITGVGTSGRM